MAIKKLTLSVPEEVIADAKRIAAKKGTSVSALFVRLLRTVDQEVESQGAFGPITLRASGIVRLPKHSARDLLEDALDERYGHR